MEEPGRSTVVGPVGGALRDPAGRRADLRLDSRLPPRVGLSDDLRWSPREPVRADHPTTLRSRGACGDQSGLGGPHSHAAAPAHGLLPDRAAYQGSADYAGAPEAAGAASAEPVASHGDRVAARACEREARPRSPATQLLADRRELVSRLGGHCRRPACPGIAGRLQPDHGSNPGWGPGGGPKVSLEAIRAREDTDHRGPRCALCIPASRPGIPPARPAWVSGDWSLSPRITRPGTSPASFHKSSRRT